MKNFEKYKTAEEREAAFVKFCALSFNCDGCSLRSKHNNCQFYWLELEADEEKPLPCPFCGSETHAEVGEHFVNVKCDRCDYNSRGYRFTDVSIAAHNRVAKAVMENKAK